MVQRAQQQQQQQQQQQAALAPLSSVHAPWVCYTRCVARDVGARRLCWRPRRACARAAGGGARVAPLEERRARGVGSGLSPGRAPPRARARAHTHARERRVCMHTAARLTCVASCLASGSAGAQGTT